MNRIIAVDGPAASGKSSIAKILASRIDFRYLDTGSLYRALTLYMLENKVSPRDTQSIQKSLGDLKLEVLDNLVYVNKEDVTDKLKTQEIEKYVPFLAKLDIVRSFVRNLQRKIAYANSIVIDGRDIGETVFPDAFCKFFLEASLHIRAERRFREIGQEPGSPSLQEIEKQILRRDAIDKSRSVSPMRIANDALIIDTSKMTVDEIIDTMVAHYNFKLKLGEDYFSTTTTGLQSEEFVKSLQEHESKSSSDTQMLSGVVYSIGKSEIILTIAGKRDAYISREETLKLLSDEKTAPKVGDSLDVMRLKNTSDGILVSKLKADKNRGIITVKENFTNNTSMLGRVFQEVKGGYLVEMEGVQVFCPMSEYFVRHETKGEKQVDRESHFFVIDIKDSSVVVSRKRYIEKIAQARKEEFFGKVKVAEEYTATLVSFVEGSLLVQIQEYVNAIIRPREISWKRIKNLKAVFALGDQFPVTIIAIDQEHFRLEASKKQIEDNPFHAFVAKYAEDDVIKGKIVRIESYGAFVEVSDGVDGMVHVSDLSWLRRVQHPHEVVKTGDELDVKIIRIDKKNMRLSLGLKQIQPNPWNAMEQAYPTGTLVDLKITKTLSSGVYGLVNDEIETFLHISDTHYKNIPNVDFTNTFKAGDVLQGHILRVNKERKRLEINLKQSTGNIWEDLTIAFEGNEALSAQVSEVVENGINVKISDDIVGFCHTSQLSDQPFDKIEDVMTLGDTHSFFIQSISKERQQIRLSRKDFLEHEKRKDVQSYLNSDGSSSRKIDLKNLMK